MIRRIEHRAAALHPHLQEHLPLRKRAGYRAFVAKLLDEQWMTLFGQPLLSFEVRCKLQGTHVVWSAELAPEATPQNPAVPFALALPFALAFFMFTGAGFLGWELWASGAASLYLGFRALSCLLSSPTPAWARELLREPGFLSWSEVP